MGFASLYPSYRSGAEPAAQYSDQKICWPIPESASQRADFDG
jgi:hypothetical protein